MKKPFGWLVAGVCAIVAWKAAQGYMIDNATMLDLWQVEAVVSPLWLFGAYGVFQFGKGVWHRFCSKDS